MVDLYGRSVLVEQARKIADQVAARLGLHEVGPRRVSEKVARDAWARGYYTDQPNMRSGDVDPSREDVLDALRMIPAVRALVDVDEMTLIADARRLGATWEQVGVALGRYRTPDVARSSVRDRFRALGGDPTTTLRGGRGEAAATLDEAEVSDGTT